MILVAASANDRFVGVTEKLWQGRMCNFLFDSSVIFRHSSLQKCTFLIPVETVSCGSV